MDILQRTVSFRKQSNDPNSLVFNVENLIESNNSLKKEIWKSDKILINAMSINPNGEIGSEVHHDSDQFIKIISGRARILMGQNENNYNYERVIDDDHAVIIPAGTWHNIISIGDEPLKLLSIYAPPEYKS